MKLSKIAILSAAAMLALSANVATSQAATVGVQLHASSTVSVEARITKMKDRANQEIDRRITSLTKLATRVNQAVKLSASEKASLNATIQLQIGNMTTLKAKIAADTDLTSLTADVKSITDSYRIFMLVIPEGSIVAATDRIETIATSMTALSVKLQARVTASTSTSTVALFADMNAKVTDAQAQAVAAQNEVVNLQPDNGNATVAASNKSALLDARAKIKIAVQDLKDARKDADKIYKLVK